MDRLVSHEWLAAHLANPNLVVLDATIAAVGVSPAPDVFSRYLDLHIPRAIFYDIEALSDHGTSLPHMLPSAANFGRSMAALGIGDASHIVIYEQQGVFSAPRAWWMLRAFGAKNVSLLDGDLHAWISAGHPIGAGPEHREPVAFEAILDNAFVKDLTAIRAFLAQGGQVLDARSAARFDGTAPEPRPGLSPGHMPGALNLPFTDLIQDGRLQGADQLRAAFTSRGIDLDRPITTTCGSGITAAVLALALDIAGAQEVSLYDGSWAEYASQPDAVIKTHTAPQLLHVVA